VFKLSHSVLSSQGRIVRWGILGFSSAPLLGAYCYNQGDKIPFLVCPIRHFTGIPCPTCGMTRSFMAIARGDFSQAVNYHLFGLVLFVGFAIAIIHVILELATKRRITAFYCQVLGQKEFQLFGLFIFLSYYAFRLYQLWWTGDSPLSN
jgi:hypothetical protein